MTRPPRTPEDPAVPRRLAILVGLLLMAVVLWVSAKALGFGLVAFDDDINVTFNPHLGPPTQATLRWLLTDIDYVRRYIPLGWLSFSCIFGASALEPLGYHLVAVGFHVLNAGLAYALLLFLLDRWRPSAPGDWKIAVAFLGAGVWALHPMRVETSGWASGLLYGQAACFALVSLLCFLRGREEPVLGGRRPLWLALSAVAYLGSLLTYPIAIGWSALYFLFDFWDWRRPAVTGVSRTRLLLEKWVVIVPAALVGALTVYAGYHAQTFWPAPPSLQEFPLFNRWVQACYVFAYYLWRPFWPFHLTPEPTQLIDFNPTGPLFILSSIAVVSITLIVFSVRRRRAAIFFWLGYLALLLPMAGLTVSPHYTNDRYAYLPALLEMAVLAGLLVRLSREGARAAVLGSGLVVIAYLGVLSSRQLEIWRSTDSVYTRLAQEAAYKPAKAHVLARWALHAAMTGDDDKAQAILQEGQAEMPDAPEFVGEAKRIADMKAASAAAHPDGHGATIEANLHLEFALDASRRDLPAAARAHFEKAVEQAPQSTEALYDFGVFEAVHGNPDAALHLYDRIPDFGTSRGNRARLLALIANAFDQRGRPALANHAVDQAIALVGDDDTDFRARLLEQKASYQPR